MFDYLLSKPLTEESFSTIKNRLKKIYDHIIKNAKYYDENNEEEVKNLFKSLDEIKSLEEMIQTTNYDNVYVYSPDDIDKIKNLFISRQINEDEVRERLNDIIGTFSYAVSSFIEDAMESWYYYKKDCFDPELSYNDKNFYELINSEHAITDLVDILFGFEGE